MEDMRNGKDMNGRKLSPKEKSNLSDRFRNHEAWQERPWEGAWCAGLEEPGKAPGTGDWFRCFYDMGVLHIYGSLGTADVKAILNEDGMPSRSSCLEPAALAPVSSFNRDAAISGAMSWCRETARKADRRQEFVRLAMAVATGAMKRKDVKAGAIPDDVMDVIDAASDLAEAAHKGRKEYLDTLQVLPVTETEQRSLLEGCIRIDRDYLSMVHVLGLLEAKLGSSKAGRAPGQAGHEAWAVFEAWSGDAVGPGKNSIYDYDCAACFPTEAEAEAYRADNPDVRVTKRVAWK